MFEYILCYTPVKKEKHYKNKGHSIGKKLFFYFSSLSEKFNSLNHHWDKEYQDEGECKNNKVYEFFENIFYNIATYFSVYYIHQDYLSTKETVALVKLYKAVEQTRFLGIFDFDIVGDEYLDFSINWRGNSIGKDLGGSKRNWEIVKKYREMYGED